MPQTDLQLGTDRWLDHYMAAALFLIPAIALVAPTGYSWGAALLLIGAVVTVFARQSLPQAWSPLPLLVKAIIGAMLIYAAVWIADAALRGEGVREFDRPSRFLFAALCLIAITQCRIHQAWLWAGLGVGGIATGAMAAWEKLVEGASRASGTAQTIQFGNLAMMMGLMCLAGLLWAGTQHRHRVWQLFLSAGAIGGMSASFFSGTRGAWLMPIVMGGIGLWAAMQQRRLRRYLWVAPVMLAIVYGAAYLAPQTGVKSRVDTAATQVVRYFADDQRGGSVGYRFEMWRGGWILFTQSPVIGWGENAYIANLRALGEEGVIVKGASRFTHGHNDWINVLAKRGAVGALILLALYGLPIVWFMRFGRRHDGDDARGPSSYATQRLALATAGLVLPSSFIVGGMTQVSLNHNSGAMMYAFMLASLVGLSVNELGRER